MAKIIPKRTTLLQKLAYILKPFVVYMVVKTVIMFLLAVVIPSLPIAGIAEWVEHNSQQLSAVVNGVASMAAAGFLLNVFLVEASTTGEIDIDQSIPGQFVSFVKTDLTGARTVRKAVGLVLCVLLGITASLALNILVELASAAMGGSKTQILDSEKYVLCAGLAWDRPVRDHLSHRRRNGVSRRALQPHQKILQCDKGGRVFRIAVWRISRESAAVSVWRGDGSTHSALLRVCRLFCGACVDAYVRQYFHISDIRVDRMDRVSDHTGLVRFFCSPVGRAALGNRSMFSRYLAISSMISPMYIVCRSPSLYHLAISGEMKASSVSFVADSFWHRRTKLPSSMNGIECL